MLLPVRRLIFAGILFAAALLHADIPTNSNWSVHAWQSDDGLPNDNVAGLAQTSDGFLWVATDAGIARFDGVRFEAFSRLLIASGYNQRASAVLRTKAGQLWIATDHGRVLCLEAGTVRSFTEGFPDAKAKSLIEDGEGAVWVVYRHGDRSVFRIKGNKVQGFSTADDLPSGFDTSLVQDKTGVIWFAKNGQAGVFRDGRFRTLVRTPTGEAIIRLASSNAGGVWICAGNRLSRHEENGTTEDHGILKFETASAEPNTMLEDHQGAVWIGTSSGGLYRYLGGTLETVPTLHRSILCLLEDQEHNIWIGTDGGGLNRVRPRVVSVESAQIGFPDDAVQSVCQDSRGVIWATTQSGTLIRRASHGWETVSKDRGWPGGRATCVVATRTGELWIGTRDYRLHLLRDGQFRTWRKGDGLSSRHIHTLLLSTAGDLWIGGNAPESLQCMRAEKLLSYQLPADVRVMQAMTEDRLGDIWIGTSKGILLRVRAERVEQIPHLTQPSMSIRSLYPTPDGSLWIGYAAWGLGRLKENQLVQITTARGMYDDYISHIVSDQHGWFWFGANHGIFKVRQRELDQVADGHSDRVHSIRYGRGQGLPSLQANVGNSPGTIRAADGSLWFPMRTALAVVRPNHADESVQPPAVLLKQVTMDDEILASYGGNLPVGAAIDLNAPPRNLRLPPTHRRLEFEYTALSFSAPENVRFQYRLDGVDDHWIEGTQRTASYSRLSAGDYRFRVKACNGAGVWNETGTALAFSVAPFLWQTWWFQLATIITFSTTLIVAARYVSFRRLQTQLRTLEQQALLHKEKARIAQDLHDDLGGNITQMKLLFELLERDRTTSEEIRTRVRQGVGVARQAIESLDETVWAVNPRNDTLPHLIDYISQFAVEFLRTAGIQCHVNLPDHPPHLHVPAEVRHSLFLVIKEALHNVVRHAKATQVRICAEFSHEVLTLFLEDNGCGFEANSQQAGADGLHNMHQRMAQIGGHFQCTSNPQSGTLLTISIPLKGSTPTPVNFLNPKL